MADMAHTQTEEPASRRPLRLWPGVAAAVLQLLLRFGVPVVTPDSAAIGGLGGVVCALAILVWWMFFSRVPWPERWGAVGLAVVALAAAPLILHESIVDGMMGMMFYLYAIPVVSLALVGWAVACQGLAELPRRAALAASVLLACGVFALLRTDGILGGGGSELAWRWTPTAEERLLARAADDAALVPPAATDRQDVPPSPATTDPVEAATPGQPPAQHDEAGAATPADDKTAAPPPAEAVAGVPEGRLSPDGKIAIESRHGGQPAAIEEGLASAPTRVAPKANPGWPGFRGPDRSGAAPGVHIETDWSKSPPVELWRRPVGPGWSSFAVDGNLFYTQEQRGDDEVVSCYNLTTGEPVWMHRDAARFWESNAGAGPRATPTLSNGRVYTFGATGILNSLDARNGALVWTRNAASDTGAKTPYWGFSSSPLVVDDLVIVAAAGQLAAYDLATGEPRWTGPAKGDSYSSPHHLTIDGVPQIVLLSTSGASSVAPADGTLLWEHDWAGFPSLQPSQTAGGDLLITTAEAMGGVGTRRLTVGQSPSGWKLEERWTSRGLKPYFNDLVVHEGHAYGFDGRILSCIDLADGGRQWKGGRYGNGQLILLPDQDVLLVLSDEGELALVSASPSEFNELGRFPAIEGKTWNHPALAGDIVLVRNDQEMAAFRLAPEG